VPSKVTIDQLGAVGKVSSLAPEELPPNALTRTMNIRCRNGYITPQNGHVSVYDTDTNLGGDAYYLLHATIDNTDYYFFPVDTDADGAPDAIYSYDGSSAVNRTRTTGGAYSSANNWNGCILHDVCVLNNGGDCPQVFAPGDTDFSNLIWDGSNDWDDYDGLANGYHAKVIRSHRNFLFAMNITDDADTPGVYPSMVHYSGPALPGAAPVTWDYVNETEPNRLTLSETTGECLDGLTLQDAFVVYKSDSVFLMTFTDNPVELFASRMLFGDRGILATNCVCDIGGRHFVVGTGRVYIHDGNQPQDILEGRNKDEFFESIDPINYQKTFVVHHERRYEVWICYPTVGQTSCDKALIYNYRENTWFEREIPSLHHAATGEILETPDSDTYDSETTLTYDSEDYLTYDQSGQTYSGDRLIGAGAEIWHIDEDFTFDGADPDCVAERTGIVLNGADKWHMVVACYPRVSGDDSFELNIGSQKYSSGPVTWGDAKTVTPGETRKLSFRVNGPIHAWRATGSGSWRLYALDLHVEETGSNR